MSLFRTLHSAACFSVLILQILGLIPLSLYYILRCTRPHAGFTWQQALGRRFLFDLMAFYTRIRLVTNLPLSPGGLGERVVSIPPASNSCLYRGPLSDPEIHPTTVSGTWYPAAPHKSTSLRDTAREGGGILLHFHGGGYVIGSGRPLDSGHMANILTRYVTPFALFAEYRLSCSPDGRFPAALQDGLSAYLFLLDQGVQPQHIVLSGDSAGGHLVVSLLRYIDEFLAPGTVKPSIQAPSCALLWSPWIDVAGAASASDVASRPRYHTDYLPASFAEWAVAAFAPLASVDRDSEYVTLLHRPFKTKTKLWAHVGALELLYDEVIEWTEEMRQVGCDISLIVAERAYHDVVESSYINGFKAESEKAACLAGEFVWRVLSP